MLEILGNEQVVRTEPSSPASLTLDAAAMNVVRTLFDESRLREFGSRIGIGSAFGHLTVGEANDVGLAVHFDPVGDLEVANRAAAAKPFIDLLLAIARAARGGCALTLPQSVRSPRPIQTTGPRGRLLARYNQYSDTDRAAVRSLHRWIEIWSSGSVIVLTDAGPDDRGIEDRTLDVGPAECARLADLIASAIAGATGGGGASVVRFECDSPNSVARTGYVA